MDGHSHWQAAILSHSGPFGLRTRIPRQWPNAKAFRRGSLFSISARLQCQFLVSLEPLTSIVVSQAAVSRYARLEPTCSQQGRRAACCAAMEIPTAASTGHTTTGAGASLSVYVRIDCVRAHRLCMRAFSSSGCRPTLCSSSRSLSTVWRSDGASPVERSSTSDLMCARLASSRRREQDGITLKGVRSVCEGSSGA